MVQEWKWELMTQLGYTLYLFRMNNVLTHDEMYEVLTSLMETRQFKKEYGVE